MVFKIPVQPFPEIDEVYEIERKTVWRCADMRSILLFIVDGACQIELENKKILLKKGDVFLIPSGTEYARRPVRDLSCRMFYIHFKTPCDITRISIEEAKSELRDRMVRFATHSVNSRYSCPPEYMYLMQHTSIEEDTERLCEPLRQILAHSRMEPDIASLFVSLRFVEFLANISLRITSVATNGTVHHDLPPTLRQALSFIQQNHDKKISTKHICAHCHISPQHLIRLFKKYFGITPVQYITKNKMSHAVEHLLHSELSIKEIAYTLGYENPNYFSRLFTKEEAFSPTVIRERIINYRDGEGALREK